MMARAHAGWQSSKGGACSMMIFFSNGNVVGRQWHQLQRWRTGSGMHVRVAAAKAGNNSNGEPMERVPCSGKCLTMSEQALGKKWLWLLGGA
ncbi:hypothetical protein COCNU_scaffold015663G000010 [Cocos nucifera]|nr:hypothetical protein [Cocos nucifera]